jgi:CHAD domain-containing protein
MRVATRRLRAALEVFEPCFPRKRLKEVLVDVKSLADALGERRDRDVQIAALERSAERTAATKRSGIDSLISRLREEQNLANRALGAALDGGRVRTLGGRVERMLATIAERNGTNVSVTM